MLTIEEIIARKEEAKSYWHRRNPKGDFIIGSAAQRINHSDYVYVDFIKI